MPAGRRGYKVPAPRALRRGVGRLGASGDPPRGASEHHARATYEADRTMRKTLPAIHRVIETALYIEDQASARHFYVDVLGFRVILEGPRMLALDVAGRSVLLLFQRGMTTEPLVTPNGVIPPHDAKGQQHLAFAIPSGSLEPWAEHLASNGIVIESRVRWPRGGQSLYVRDPEGHSVEFATPGLWETY